MLSINPHNGCYAGECGIVIFCLCGIMHAAFGHLCYAERSKVPPKSQHNI